MRELRPNGGFSLKLFMSSAADINSLDAGKIMVDQGLGFVKRSHKYSNDVENFLKVRLRKVRCTGSRFTWFVGQLFKSNDLWSSLVRE